MMAGPAFRKRPYGRRGGGAVGEAMPGYTAAMSRFVAGQIDLFAPEAAPEPPPPARPPLEELADILATLRAAEHLPWPDLTLAMAAEQHVLSLARIAGAEGQSLAATIMDETERLFAADEQAAMRAHAPAGSGP
jgi:hypothetical protein